MARGGSKWVPKNVIDELEQIKKKFGFDSEGPAFQELVRRSRVGHVFEEEAKAKMLKERKKRKDEFSL